MDELILLAVGASITGVTQFLKRFTDINPLVIAAALALIGGLVYAGLHFAGYWEAIKSFVTVAWPTSVLLYQLFKQALQR